MKPALALAVWLLAVGLFAATVVSPLDRTDFFNLAAEGDTLQLAHRNVLKGSQTVWLTAPGDTLHLAEGRDYRLHWPTGRLILHTRPVQYTHAAVSYLIYPVGLTARFWLFTPVDDTLHVPETSAPRRVQWGEGTKLNISGSKSVTLSVGSGKDMSIDQSLFVRMDGELGTNVFVEAQLSDSYTPVTPEGDSRELSSLDQVFIRLYGDPYEIAFGDLDFPFTPSAFMNWNPQYEGLRAGWFGGVEARGALAVSRAQSATLEFGGVEAKQGPYYLVIDADNVQVVAGSETIYLDGVAMRRGSDYTIDYAAGSITFTERHFISENSRVLAVFQYADEDYRKNMYLSEALVPVGERLRLGVRLAVQNDDRDNPLQAAFSDDDKALLRAAGDSAVWGESAIEVEQGEGAYTLTGDPPHYEYVGYDSTGTWQVSFTFVGYGLGDYEPITPSSYAWVGEGLGSYTPQRRLPAPQFRANYGLCAAWEDDGWRLAAEALFAQHDRNTLSSLDDDDNDVLAWQAEGALYPDWDRLRPRLDLRYRDIGADLFTFAELADPYDSYETAGFASMDSLRRRELRADASLELWRTLTPLVGFEYRDAAGEALYRRLMAGLRALQTNWTPWFSASASRAEQDWRGGDPVTYLNRILDAQSTYTRWQARLGGHWRRSENKTERPATAITGSRLITRETWLETVETQQLAGRLGWEDERNDILDGDWSKQRSAWTASGETMIERERLGLQAQYAHREVSSVGATGDETYDQAGLAVQSRPWGEGLVFNGRYALKNVSFYPRVRELVWVGAEGLYDSTGVYEEDGEYDWTYVHTGQSELTIEVDASLTVSLFPRLLLPEGSTSPLTRLQSETNLVVFENSRSGSRWDVYLLNPAALIDNSSTIYGRQSLRQTFWYDLVRRRVLAKLSGRFDRTLDQRYQEAERFRSGWWEASLLWQRLGVHDIELAYERRREEDSRYDSKIMVQEARVELVSRPSGAWLLQSGVEYMVEQGDHEGADESYGLTGLGLSELATYFAGTSLRVFGRIEYRRLSRNGSSYLTTLPGKRAGDHIEWSASLNYRLNAWTNLTTTYSGDSFPHEKTTHRMQMDVRAEF